MGAKNIKNFQGLLKKQVQKRVDAYGILLHETAPKQGWIRTIRDALGMSAAVLAQRLGCQPANVKSAEIRESKRAITLDTLERFAQALDCKLVYGIVPLEPFDRILEKQARKIAQQRVQMIDHSMKLEEQGLTKIQLKQQEDDLVQELLQEHPKRLWVKD